jgi:DNA-binding transcriptional regulator YiaG
VTPSDFRAARKRLGLSRDKMAEALGVSGTTISNWSWGHAPIPTMVALAIEALDARAEKAA